MKLDAFTRAYIEAALWSSTDESNDQGGDPLDANYSIDDIAPETMELIVEDCADFQNRFGHLLAEGGDEQAGHDFWLTRVESGAGFWDGDWPEHGDELTEAAQSYGNFNLYVGDDGLIYGPPPDWYRSHRKTGGAKEAVPRPRRSGVRAPARRHTTVRDFSTLPELIEHARGEGATHVVVNTTGNMAWLYFPIDGGKAAEARVRHERGYWHAEGPENRDVVDRIPRTAQPIESYLTKSWRRTAEATRPRRGHSVRDYIAVDHRGKPLSGPTKDYSAAKRQADQAGGFVKFATDPPGKLSEAWGRNKWPDWQILDAIDKGHMVPPESEARAAKLAQLGFIDTTGTWRLTAKGRRAIEQRVPVAAEAKRSGRTRKTTETAMQIAEKLSKKVGGGKPKPIPGGFRWSEKNESAQFTTYSPEHGQKIVVVVSVFPEDGSAALNFFSDESLSGTATYENISSFTYGPGGFTSHQVDVKHMAQDVDWVLKTVDGYAASWEQPEVDEVPPDWVRRAQRERQMEKMRVRRPSKRRQSARSRSSTRR
jgi:hypothetical protein